VATGRADLVHHAEQLGLADRVWVAEGWLKRSRRSGSGATGPSGAAAAELVEVAVVVDDALEALVGVELGQLTGSDRRW
jgi:hypothetical protein